MSRHALVLAMTLCGFLSNSAASANDERYSFVSSGRRMIDSDAELSYELTVGASQSGAIRLIDPTMARDGVLQKVGAEVAFTSWLSAEAWGLLSLANVDDDPASAAAGLGLHASLLRTPHFLFGLELGAHRELGGTFAARTNFVAEGQWHSFHSTANFELERRFESHADPIDALVRVAVGYDASANLDLALEYVGQDLEDLIEDEEAEGGASHVIAPSVRFGLWGPQAEIGFAPGVTFTADRAGFMGRASFDYSF